MQDIETLNYDHLTKEFTEIFKTYKDQKDKTLLKKFFNLSLISKIQNKIQNMKKTLQLIQKLIQSKEMIGEYLDLLQWKREYENSYIKIVKTQIDRPSTEEKEEEKQDQLPSGFFYYRSKYLRQKTPYNQQHYQKAPIRVTITHTIYKNSREFYKDTTEQEYFTTTMFQNTLIHL